MAAAELVRQAMGEAAMDGGGLMPSQILEMIRGLEEALEGADAEASWRPPPPDLMTPSRRTTVGLVPRRGTSRRTRAAAAAEEDDPVDGAAMREALEDMAGEQDTSARCSSWIR